MRPSDDALDDPPWEAPSVAPDDIPVRIPVNQWMVTTFPAGGQPLSELLDFNLLEYPNPGTDQGVYWDDVVPAEDGSIAISGAGQLFYAVTQVSLDAATNLVVNPDGVSTLWANGVVHAGDPYRSGRHRIPIALPAGKSLIVVFGARRGSAPRITLDAVSQELSFNLHDVTAPELEASPPHAQFLGLPILNMTPLALLDIRAIVVESDHVEPSELRVPSLASRASVQIPFELKPKVGIPTDGEPIDVTIRIESPSLDWTYERQVPIQTRDPASDAPIRRTFRSTIDRSAQFYGARMPREFEPGKQYGLVLSLHGAGVGGRGQAGSYGPKDWSILVAPTNRRPFGFDWEQWGRLDGLEVFELAKSAYPIDETRTSVTGHSMGGHGTWQFGTLFPGKFAVVGPSAGWISFETYTGPAFSTNLFGWAARSSNTLNQVENLANRAVYAIHGTADDNVPIAQMHQMLDILEPMVPDLHSHEEPGAGHWWDGDLAEGADCVDWPPLMDLMQERTLDLTELNFTFVSPSPHVSPTHSYATIQSALTPAAGSRLVSTHADGALTLVTENVRGMVLDGAALSAKQLTSINVDGQDYSVSEEPILIGPQDGKTPQANGPLAQVFQQPFCLTWMADGPAQYPQYAALLLTQWNIIGNGTGCAVPFDQLTAEIRAEHNIIYLGVPSVAVDIPPSTGLGWDDAAVHVDGQAYGPGLLAAVFPENGRLGATIVATRTSEHLLRRIAPFSSRFWLPDWLVLGVEGVETAGYFDPTWSYDSNLSLAAP